MDRGTSPGDLTVMGGLCTEVVGALRSQSLALPSGIHHLIYSSLAPTNLAVTQCPWSLVETTSRMSRMMVPCEWPSLSLIAPSTTWPGLNRWLYQASVYTHRHPHWGDGGGHTVASSQVLRRMGDISSRLHYVAATLIAIHQIFLINMS